METNLTFEQLCERAEIFVTERDWRQYHSPRNLAMAISVEANELLELYLWSTDRGPQPINHSRKQKVAGEAADVLLCLINFCREAEIDLLEALSEKLDVAEKKYPVERVKGRAMKYNEYSEWTDKGS